MDEITARLTPDQRILFDPQFTQERKSAGAGILLALLLGGLGAHRFYMNQIGWGLLYLAFCWTLIPMLVALVEAFLMPSRVGRHNRAVAARITGSLARTA